MGKFAIKPIILAISTAIGIAACNSDTVEEGERSIASERVDFSQSLTLTEADSSEVALLRDFAFCVCLTHVYPEDETLADDGSAGAYLELGSAGFHSYEVLDSLAAEFAKTPLPSKHNHALGIMKCLNFYNSQELLIAIEKIMDEEGTR